MSSSTAFVRPFARHGNWTVFDNALVDTLLPHLAPSSWAVLSVILRQTSGWQRDVVGASQQDLADATGMRPSTVAAALAPLLDPETFPATLVDHRCGGVLLSNGDTRSRREPTVYRLNPDFRLRTNAVRRLRDDDPSSVPEVTIYTARLQGSDSPSTTIFEVLSTTIFGALYKEAMGEAKKGGAAPQPPTRLSDVADHLAAIAETIPLAKQAGALVKAARALYGDEGIPEGRAALIEAGALRKFARGTGGALRLLVQYALEPVKGSPFRYVMAAHAARRRDVEKAQQEGAPQRATAAGPVHGSVYDLPTVRAFVDAGAPREAFEGAGTDERGERRYRFIDPHHQA